MLADSAWAASARRLQSISGIGLITAAWILVATVHFTLCPTAEAAVGYAGLNPLKGDSGTGVRKRAARARGPWALARGAVDGDLEPRLA